MEAANEKIIRRNNHSQVKVLQKDPELEAEIRYAKEKGFEPPRILPSDAVKKFTETFEEHCVIDKNLIKNLKNGRAERKARSRGVSGCSIKKDGNRFEYGLDCIDMAYNSNDKYSDKSGSDSEDAAYDEYADYVCKYSDEEIRQIVGDFLENGDMDETLESLEKFIITSDTVHRMVKDLILVTLENLASSFNLSAKLLNAILANKWVTLPAIVETLEDLVTSVEDLSTDTPKAAESLAIFIAKLVEHNILTMSILNLMATKDGEQNEAVKQCFDDAIAFANNRHLLNGKCAPCGGQQSNDVLSAQFKLILKEYLQSNDKEAAEQRLAELKVPHFNHEFVYQACLLALEQMHDPVMVTLSNLLKDMSDKGNLAESCIIKGFRRLFNDLADLYLDLPAAYVLAKRWVDKTLKIGFINEELASECPQGTIRTRSRTISEGPDGKLVVDDEEKPGLENGNGGPILNGHTNGHMSLESDSSSDD